MNKTFDKIKLSQLHTLCNILAETQMRHVSNIKRKYLEKAMAFDETLSLLKKLKIIENNFDELSPSKAFSNAHDSIDKFRKQFLQVLFSANGEVSEELKYFLVNFQTESDKIFFKATDLQKIKFSDTRNLLLELRFISTGPDNATYFVNPEFTELFVMPFSRKKLSPGLLRKKQAENDSIGLLAEEAVIDFEIQRLTDISFQSSEIEHISQDDVLAGYDIKSFENYLDSDLKRIYRYIEVKAVSAEDYKFYWSRNEMEIAKVLGEMYNLYLVPVVSNNIFDFQKMIIINNPFKNIYLNEIDWKKEQENISFSKRFCK